MLFDFIINDLDTQNNKYKTSKVSSVTFAIASNGEPYIQIGKSSTSYYQLTFKSDGLELGQSIDNTWTQLWRLYSTS